MGERRKRGISRLTEGKKNIIQALIEEYDIETTEDIQEALKDLLGGTIENMMQTEMNHHLGYEPYERTTETKIIPKRKKDVLSIQIGDNESSKF